MSPLLQRRRPQVTERELRAFLESWRRRALVAIARRSPSSLGLVGTSPHDAALACYQPLRALARKLGLVWPDACEFRRGLAARERAELRADVETMEAGEARRFRELADGGAELEQLDRYFLRRWEHAHGLEIRPGDPVHAFCRECSKARKIKG